MTCGGRGCVSRLRAGVCAYAVQLRRNDMFVRMTSSPQTCVPRGNKRVSKRAGLMSPAAKGSAEGKGRIPHLPGGEDFAAVEGDAAVDDVQPAARCKLAGGEDHRREEEGDL